jgi:uncharacterized protein YbjT (DUF2867 family)
MKLQFTAIMFSTLSMQRSVAFVARQASQTRAASSSAFAPSLSALAAEKGQAEVVLVGCGAPNRGMGWYHAIQMLEKR